MPLRDLVFANRSFRRFDEGFEISRQTLEELVDLGRLCPSGSNLQPLKYALVNTPQTNAQVFGTLAWAGYLKDWDGPTEGERPSAYIVVLGDTSVSKGPYCDHGISAQTILLGAAELGLGGCMIGSVKRDQLREILALPEHLDILLVLALGKPVERVALEDVSPDGSIKYYRDDSKTHHVPKRALKDVIIS